MQRLFRLSLMTLILGILAFSGSIAQNVFVSGNIESGHIRLFVKDSIYIFNRDYNVHGTLIVEPGTKVKFNPNGRVIVHAGGRIIADGNAGASYNANPDGIDPTEDPGSSLNPDSYEGYSDIDYFLRTPDYTPGASQATIDIETEDDLTVHADKWDYMFNILINKESRDIEDLKAEDIGTTLDSKYAKVRFEKALMFKAARLQKDPDQDINLRINPWQRVNYEDPDIGSDNPIEFIGQPVDDFSREWGHIVILPGARAAFFRNVIFEGFRKDTTVDRTPYYSAQNLPGLTQAQYNMLNNRMRLLTNGGGGAITTFSSRTWLLGCTFKRNMARYKGGALQILQAPHGLPQADIEAGYYATDKNPNITNKDGSISDIIKNNPIRAVDRIDEPGSMEPLTYMERLGYDDARIAVYLGRMRDLRFDGNFVQLAKVKFTRIGNRRIVEDDIENPADYPQTLHNYAYGGAIYIAGRDENHQMEVGFGINHSIKIDGNVEDFDERDQFVAIGNYCNNYQSAASTLGARGGALYLGEYTSAIIAGEFSHNKTFTKFLQNEQTGKNSGYYSMGGAIFTRNSLNRLQVRGGPERESCCDNETRFYQNEAGAGGAIYVDGGSVEHRESPVIGGSDHTAATRDMGFNIMFHENKANSWGGAIYSNRHMSINGAGGILAEELIGYGGKYPVRFWDNSAGYAGGALHLEIPMPQGPEMRRIQIIRAEFRGNVVGEGIADKNKTEIRGGGAVYALNADLNLVQATEFRENTLYNGNGAAVCLVHPQSSFRRYFLSDLDETDPFTDPQTGLVTGFESRDDVFTFNNEDIAPDQRMLTRFLDNKVEVDDEILDSESGSGTTQIGAGTLRPTTGLFGTTWLDNNTGYAVGYNGVIIKLTQGGSQWSYQESGTTKRLNAAAFTGVDVGFAVGGVAGSGDETGVMLKTVNGGSTWNEVSLPIDKAINDIAFVGSNVGFAVCEDGYILKTTDGGDSWTYSRPETSDLYGVAFISVGTGFVVGEMGLILRTEDGGASWDNQLVPGIISNFNDIFFVNTSTGYVFANAGYVIKTTNGGDSWTAIDLDISDDLNAGYFTGPDVGFAVGSFGTIVKTMDGGDTWDEITTTYSQTLYDVFFPRTTTGYAVGRNGLGIKTTDGGDNWLEFKPADESTVDVNRLHQEIMLPENGVGLGGALYILDSVTVNRVGRTDSVFFNRVRMQDNQAYTGAAVYSDNFDLKLIFSRSLIQGNSVSEKNDVGVEQNAIFGPVIRDQQDDEIEYNEASHDLASSIIYGEIQGPLPSGMYSEAANSIYDNHARFFIRLPDAPNTKGVLAGTTGIGYGGTDTLRGNYWGHTEADVNLYIDNSHMQGNQQYDSAVVETFFIEEDGDNHLWFNFAQTGDRRSQGPFEFTYGYEYDPIRLANQDNDENVPADETIPEQLLMSGRIYDIYDKGVDIKTADYSQRRMSPIEDFAVGIPPNIKEFQDDDNPELPSNGKYVKRWVRDPFVAEATDDDGDLKYPIINTLQDEFRPNEDGEMWHPIGYPLYLEAEVDYDGLAEISNFDYRTLNETVFFVINETTGDFIRVNMEQASNDAPLRETFRARVELVPDSTNRNADPTIRRTGEGLANFGVGPTLLSKLEDNPYNEDAATLPGRRYHTSYTQFGNVSDLFSNRPGMPDDNNGTATFYAGERFEALPVDTGDVVRVVSRTRLWKYGVPDAINKGIEFKVTRAVEPPIYTGNVVNLKTDTIVKIRPSDFPSKRYDTVRLDDFVNTIFVTEDRQYPVEDGYYSEARAPAMGEDAAGRDSILTLTAKDTNQYYDPRSYLTDDDLDEEFPRLTYFWEVHRNSGLKRWLFADTIPAAGLNNYQNPRDEATGYVMFRGKPINPYVVPGGDSVTVWVENYPPHWRTIDSLKNADSDIADEYIDQFIHLFKPYLSVPDYLDDPDELARYLQQDTIDVGGGMHFRSEPYTFKIFVVDSVPRFLEPGTDETVNMRFDSRGDSSHVYVEYKGSEYPCGQKNDGSLIANLTDKLRFHADFNTDDEAEDNSPSVKGETGWGHLPEWDFRFGKTAYGFMNIAVRLNPEDTTVIDTTVYDKDMDGMEDDVVITQVRPEWMSNDYLVHYGEDADNQSEYDPFAFDFTSEGKLNVRIDSLDAYDLLTPEEQRHGALNLDTVFTVVVNDGHGGLNFKAVPVYINVAPVILPMDLPAAKEDEDYNPQLLDSSRMIKVYDPNFEQNHTFELLRPGSPDEIPRDPCYPEAGVWDVSDMKDTPDWLKINEESGLLYGTPEVKDAPKTENIGVLVRDEDGLTHVRTFTLEVEKTNHEPEIKVLENIRCVDKGQSDTIVVEVTDYDLLREYEIEELTIEVIEPQNGNYQAVPSTITGTKSSPSQTITLITNNFQADPDADDKVTIVVRVTDKDGEETEYEYKVRVSEETDFVSTLTIRNNLGSVEKLQWGTAPSASDPTTGDGNGPGEIGDIDEDLCEFEIPPLPPNDIFDARWSLLTMNGLLRSIFPRGPQNTEGIYEWLGLIQPGGENGRHGPAYPLVIEWNADEIPAKDDANLNPNGSSWYIRDANTKGNYFNINMKDGDIAKWSSQVDFTKPADNDGIGRIVIMTQAVDKFIITYDWMSPVAEPIAGLPDNVVIDQVSPNPYETGDMRIRFGIPEHGDIKLDVVDALGRTVTKIANGAHSAGYYSVDWNGRDNSGDELSTGTYSLRLTSGGKTTAYPIVIVK